MRRFARPLPTLFEDVDVGEIRELGPICDHACEPHLRGALKDTEAERVGDCTGDDTFGTPGDQYDRERNSWIALMWQRLTSFVIS